MPTSAQRQRYKPPARFTVFRRRLEREYTAVPNAIIGHPRLALDEKAALWWMLSKPPQWQMHPGQMRADWNVGRVVYYRIIASLIREGYVKRGEMLRSECGRYWAAIEYLVYDEPKAPDADLSPDDGDDGEDDSTSRAPSDGVTNSQHAGFVHADDVHADDRPPEVKIDTTNLTPPNPLNDQKRTRPGGREVPHPVPPPDAGAGEDQSDGPLPEPHQPAMTHDRGPPGLQGGGPAAQNRNGVMPGERVPSFDDFTARYGLEPWMSAHATKRRWFRLSERDRIDCYAGVNPYLDDCRAKTRKRVAAARFILDRLWVGYLGRPAVRPESVGVSPKDPAFFRWLEHYRKTRGECSEKLARRMAHKHGVLTVPSKFPPGGDPPMEPLEELRAAVLLISTFHWSDDPRVPVHEGSPEMAAWSTAVWLCGSPFAFGVGQRTDWLGPKDAQGRRPEFTGAFLPARWPPGLEAGQENPTIVAAIAAKEAAENKEESDGSTEE